MCRQFILFYFFCFYFYFLSIARSYKNVIDETKIWEGRYHYTHPHFYNMERLVNDFVSH